MYFIRARLATASWRLELRIFPDERQVWAIQGKSVLEDFPPFLLVHTDLPGIVYFWRKQQALFLKCVRNEEAPSSEAVSCLSERVDSELYQQLFFSNFFWITYLKTILEALDHKQNTFIIVFHDRSFPVDADSTVFLHLQVELIRQNVFNNLVVQFYRRFFHWTLKRYSGETRFVQLPPELSIRHIVSV